MRKDWKLGNALHRAAQLAKFKDSQRLVANMTGGLPATAAGLNRLARLKEGQAQTLLASNAKQFAVLAPAGGAVPGQAAALQGAAYNVRAASEQQRQQDQAGEAAEQPGEAAATAGVAIIAGGGVAGLYRGTKGKPRDRSVQGAPEGQNRARSDARLAEDDAGRSNLQGAWQAAADAPPPLVGADEADAQRALDEAGTFEGATKRLMPTRHSAKAGESPAKKKRRVGAEESEGEEEAAAEEEEEEEGGEEEEEEEVEMEIADLPGGDSPLLPGGGSLASNSDASNSPPRGSPQGSSPMAISPAIDLTRSPGSCPPAPPQTGAAGAAERRRDSLDTLPAGLRGALPPQRPAGPPAPSLPPQHAAPHTSERALELHKALECGLSLEVCEIISSLFGTPAMQQAADSWLVGAGVCNKKEVASLLSDGADRGAAINETAASGLKRFHWLQLCRRCAS
ncbi:hypothetical protein C2E20_0934 [Micractinium conductrix]|uniref:Uncharacterized protein n=1 Tax=Micractinium conductrix TaxID=554055 RepID=A0A2P6VPM8_9CHLO|nr:hypothetical protein C2E20_0934 [Micractinium conductrix]|eukprot:PSC76040.1 hypothetical protein C2E20_0934 [Micractinium conductrix]